MKKIVFFICIALTVFYACKKKDDATPPPAAPAADFSFSVDTTKYPALSVIFTSHSTNAKTYSWNFGDGNSSSETNPAHTYSAAGTYHVTLTATGDGGSANITKDVVIGQPLLINASYTAQNSLIVASVNLSSDSTVYDHYAFPDLAKLSDGRFIAVWRAGTQHDQNGHGKIMKSFGTADGQTWTAPALLYDDTTKDDRDPSINRLSNGTLLLDFYKWGTNQCSIIKSTDDGQTFSAPVPINQIDNGANPSNQAEEINGVLWLPTYGNDIHHPYSRIFMFNSNDLGNSWTETLIAPNYLSGLNLQEPSIVKANNNRLIMHIRTASPYTGLGNMFQTFSDDTGKTWHTPTDFGFIGHSPALYRTESGILVSAFRWLNSNATQTYVGMIYSVDNGNTWSNIIMVDDYNYECGYPGIESMGNDKFIMVYYQTVIINGTYQWQIKTKIYQFTPIYKTP